MPFYFRDRIPDKIHGQNDWFYDLVDNTGAVKVPDVRLALRNNVPPDRQGDPVNAANLNYASGNADFPAGAGQAIKRGDVLSIAGGGEVAPSFLMRAISKYGGETVTGAIHINSTQFLLLTCLTNPNTESGLRIATIDFANKTVSLGNRLSIAPSPQISVEFVELISPNLCAVRAGNYSGTSEIWFYNIAGATITLNSKLTVNGAIEQSNFVRCGDTRVLVPKIAGSAAAMLLCTVSANSSVITTTVTISEITAAGQLKALVSYDGGNSHYVLFYTNTAGTVLYARPVTVNGTTITVSANVQTVTGTGNLSRIRHSSACASTVSKWQNKALLSDGNKYQVAGINSSGVVTFGNIVTLPIYMYNDSTGLQANVPTVGLRDDGTAYVVGSPLGNAPFYSLLFDFAITGNNITVNEYNPFRVGVAGGSIINIKGIAIENPASKHEYLFIEGDQSANNPDYYFGCASDLPRPNNIAGIALDQPANGYVKVQYDGKLLADITGGLTRGRWYMPGNNGSLTPHDGSRPRIALATGSDSLLFTGAAGI